MRSDHLSKHSKIHAKKTKRPTAPTDEEGSKIKTENPPVEEHRQLGIVVEEDNMDSLPKPAYNQELSILTDQQSQTASHCATPIYANNSPKSPTPLFYSHPTNQATTTPLANHQYNNPNSAFYHFTNMANTCTDATAAGAAATNRTSAMFGHHQSGMNADSQVNGTTTSAYNEKYTYDNYHQHYPSQAQVYHINYGNSHNYH